MKKIKLSLLWTASFEFSTIFKLIKFLSKKEIEFTTPSKCDLLIIGAYDTYSIKRKFVNTLKRKINKIEDFFPNIDIYSLNRKMKPLRIFYSQENYPFPEIKFDYTITPHLGITNANHLRYPIWKDLIDWSHLGLGREEDLFIKRFGMFFNIKDLMSPQGVEFLKKQRKICLITSHLSEPRKSMYEKFSQNFTVDGYGPYFDKNIPNHNNSKIKKIDIFKDYSFNLCPENGLNPGYYTEKIPESFLGKCLPISWADNNINNDFNEKAFINLINYTKNNYQEINYLLKDESFLIKYSNEPLLINEPTLNNEIAFITKIINSL
jgi:hypothetical protein